MSTMTSVIIPPPVGGMVTESNLLNTEINQALLLENWIPELSSLVSRKGFKWFYKEDTSRSPFKSLIPFDAGANKYLFAACNQGLYITQVNRGGVKTGRRLISGGNASGWSGAIMSVDERIYMRLADGGNKEAVFNSSDPDNIEEITGSDKVPNGAAWVFMYKGRFFFGAQNSLDVYYLPVGIIKPDLSQGFNYRRFPLGQFLNKGGHVIAMSSFSYDTGSGAHNFAVFSTTSGQTCIYEGSDPDSAEDFRLVGIYDHGEPLSRRCFLRVGADLYIWTNDGMISIKDMMSRSTESLSVSKLTGQVASQIKKDIAIASAFGFDVCMYSKGSMILCNVPFGLKSKQYVFNVITGAASIFTGIDIYALAEIDNKLFGTSRKPYEETAGTAPKYGVYQLDEGDTDDGRGISLDAKHAFTFLGNSTVTKKISHVIIHLETTSNPDVKFSVLTDLDVEGSGEDKDLPRANDVALWGVDRWGEAIWGGRHQVYSLSRGVRKICRSVSFRVKAASKNNVMRLHGITVYFMYTEKTTPRAISEL